MSEAEEEFYVYAELDESVNLESYRTIHLLGIEDKNPIIQMDDSFFVGTYEHPLGTYMFFEEDPEAKSIDPLFNKLPDKSLKYFGKTRKLLKLNHSYVSPKEGGDKEILKQLQQPDEEIESVTFNSVQEAIEKFTKEWNVTTDLTSNPDCEIEADVKSQIAMETQSSSDNKAI